MEQQEKDYNMLKNITAVIFDLDGSLVDSMWIWREIDIEYLGRFGIDLPEGLQGEIEGMSFNETALFFKEKFGLLDPIETIKQDWNQMARHKYINEVPLKEGVLEFLEFCKNSGIKLGIATSNSRELVDHIANAHGLNQYFDCIITGCEITKGKPAPDIYLAVAEALNVLPSECLVFEDIIPGIMAGKSAGMKVCAVEDAYSMPQKEAKMEAADFYIEDFRKIWEM